MPRRIHTPVLTVGEISLPPSQAHHLRNVLRLGVGDGVEAFDDGGATAQATIVMASERGVTLRVSRVEPGPVKQFAWTVAAAIPKGPRADWMVEKLSELGAAAFIPLLTARGVTTPHGSGKFARWERLAAEAAEQSGRAGVMRIDGLTPLPEVLAAAGDQTGWYFSTQAGAAAMGLLTTGKPPRALLMLIGPEGGWTEQEVAMFLAARVTAVKLSRTTLRVETAAIAAAAVAAVWSAADGSA